MCGAGERAGMGVGSGADLGVLSFRLGEAVSLVVCAVLGTVV